MDGDKLTIFLVEDDAMDLELTKHALKREAPNIHIQVARDGEEAIEFLEQLTEQLPTTGFLPRLILLDLHIPKITGLDVLRRVKENPVTRIIPVVVLTSSKADEDTFRAYSLGANSYIQKPVSFDDFRKLLQNLASYWLESNLLPSLAVVRQQILNGS